MVSEKGFDRIDINILIQKINRLGSPPYLSRWIASFLAKRQQRVCYNGFESTWLDIHAGVPQGTKTGPLAFLAMINDLDVDLKFIDDSSVIETIDWPSQSKMNDKVKEIVEWTATNKMQINEKKTVEIQICFKKNYNPWHPLKINAIDIQPSKSARLLGFIINDNLNWSDHINYIHNKASKRIYFITMLKRSCIPYKKILDVYKAVIRSILEYGSPVWHSSLTVAESNSLEDIQRRVLKILYPHSSYELALTTSSLERLDSRRTSQCKRFYNSHINSPFITSVCNTNLRNPQSHNLRSRNRFNFNCRTNRFLNSFFPYANINY